MRQWTRVTQYTMEWEYVATHESMNAAAREVNDSAVTASNILECLQWQRASCGQFIWERDIDQDVPGFFSNSD